MPKVATLGQGGRRPGRRREITPKDDTSKTEAPREMAKDPEAFKSLTTTFEDLRSSLQCKICFRMLYEPYTLSCGHSYCYTCLSQWFNGTHANKTCPDCRADIAEAPAPAYLLRELTNKFVSQDHLMPTGETVLQHRAWQKEEADAVDRDKADSDPKTGGLFKGRFRRRGHWHTLRHPLRDEEDGVDRCPECTWELEEEGICAHCGYDPEDTPSIDSEMRILENDFPGISSNDELDGELDMEDGDFDAGFNEWEQRPGWRAERSGLPTPWDRDGSDSESGYDDETLLELLGSRMGARIATAYARRSAQTNGISDDSSDREMDSDEEGDDEADSSMDGFIDDNEEGTELEEHHQTSPIHHHSPEDYTHTDTEVERLVHEVDSASDTDTTTTPSPNVQQHQVLRRNRPILIDSEEESEGESEDEGGQITRRLRRRPATS